MDDLPREVMQLILSRCGVESVVRCKSVCKTWESIISDPRFPVIHRLQRSKIWENDKTYIMLGKSIDQVAAADDHDHDHAYFINFKDENLIISKETESYDLPAARTFPICYCNGLFILRYDGNYVLCNPGIRKHTMIHTDADADLAPPAQLIKRIYHFYYDSEVDDYKFIIICHYNIFGHSHYNYTMYSFKDCSWGERKDLPDYFSVHVAVDGCFYGYTYGEDGEGVIVCFDSRDGKLDKFRQPEEVEGTCEIKYLGENCGRLCLYSTVNRVRRYRLWVMENKYCWREIKNKDWIDVVICRSYSRLRMSNNMEDDGVIVWNQFRVGDSLRYVHVGDKNGFIYINRGKGFHKVKFNWSCLTPLYPYFDNLYFPLQISSTLQEIAEIATEHVCSTRTTNMATN